MPCSTANRPSSSTAGRTLSMPHGLSPATRSRAEQTRSNSSRVQPRVRDRKFFFDHQHVVDGQHAGLAHPVGFGASDICKERPPARIRLQPDGGIDLARRQCRLERYAVRRAVAVWRVDEAIHVRVFERQPAQRAEIDVELVLQDAADPCPGGLRVRAHPDALAREVRLARGSGRRCGPQATRAPIAASTPREFRAAVDPSPGQA